MTEARSYSVTPHTLCVRHEDGTKQVFLMTAPKNADGVWGYLMGGSYKAPGASGRGPSSIPRSGKILPTLSEWLYHTATTPKSCQTKRKTCYNTGINKCSRNDKQASQA